MPWAVHNVTSAHQFTYINVCCIIAHRSPPDDQQNSASTVETDQPVVGTKRARMMPGSKIVLPSSDVEEYSGTVLRSTVSRIVNPKGIILFSYQLWLSCRSEGQILLLDWQSSKLVAKRCGVLFYHRYIVTYTHANSRYVWNLFISLFLGAKAKITTVNLRTNLAAFLEKCPEQYTM